MNQPRVSFAIPVFNEEAVVPELLRRVGAVLDALPGDGHEIVVVDDGSTDGTLALLEEAAERDPRLVVLSLSRNFGHQQAICAAIDHAGGDVVLVMDGDLQDCPEALPRFLELYRQGYDVVYARRVLRKEGLLLRLCYWFFYRLIATFSQIKLPLDAGDFALLSRPVVDGLKSVPERLRYVRGLRAWVGFRQTGIEVERAQRAAGETKYGMLKLFRLAFDGIFAFSMVPLRAATALGGVAILASTIYALYAVFMKLVRHQSPQGFTALLLAVVFLSGVQLVFLGLIGEYVGRVYEEAKGRPVYIVRKRIGRAEPAAHSASLGTRAAVR